MYMYFIKKIAQSSLKPVYWLFLLSNGICLSMKRKLGKFEMEEDRVYYVHVYKLRRVAETLVPIHGNRAPH